MSTLQFKTTIKCSGCVEKITPYLNETAGANNWRVDLADPAKTLTVPNAQRVSAEDIITALEKAGYKATLVSTN